MKYRMLRVIASGQWLDVLFTVQAPSGQPDVFTVSPETHQAQMAAALGLPAAALEVVDADTDVRVGPRLPLPPPPPVLPDPDLAAYDAGTATEKLQILRRRVFRG